MLEQGGGISSSFRDVLLLEDDRLCREVGVGGICILRSGFSYFELGFLKVFLLFFLLLG